MSIDDRIVSNAMTVPAVTVFDVQHLEEVVDHDDAFAREIVHDYLAQLGDRAGELADAVARGDVPTVASIAHSIKGSSITVGAMALGEASRLLEMHARHGEVRRFAEAHDRFRAELARLEPTLRSWLGENA